MALLSKGSFKLPKCVLKKNAPRMTLPKIIRSQDEKNRRKAVSRTRIGLVGGPLDGKNIYLYDHRTGTIPFTLKGMTGRYVSNQSKSDLYWESVQ